MSRYKRFSALLAVLSITAIVGILLTINPAEAQTVSFDLGDGGNEATGRIVQIVALLTVLSLAPSILL